MTATQSNDNQVPWNIFDTFFLLLLIVIVSVVLLLCLSAVIKNQEAQYTYFSVTFSVMIIFIPYIWLKKKYNIDKAILGFKRGRYSPELKLAIGAISAFVVFFVVINNPFWFSLAIDNNVQNAENILSLLFLPFTIMGATKFLIGPFGEEILFRGLVFGYFRKKIGVQYAIIVQSVISGAFHIFYIKEAFQATDFWGLITYLIFIQVVFCLLYEKSKSLYPSIICHGMYNYLIFVYPRFQMFG